MGSRQERELYPVQMYALVESTCTSISISSSCQYFAYILPFIVSVGPIHHIYLSFLCVNGFRRDILRDSIAAIESKVRVISLSTTATTNPSLRLLHGARYRGCHPISPPLILKDNRFDNLYLAPHSQPLGITWPRMLIRYPEFQSTTRR